MTQANIHEAKTHLSRLLKKVLMGEEVVISKSGRPIAKLVPYEEKPADRQPGRDRGIIDIPEDFDAELPGDIQGEFER